MVIILKTQAQVEQIRHNGKILREAVNLAEDSCRPGMTTKQLDQIIEKYIRQHDATPTFKGYGGTLFRKPFPGSACISVNDVIVHGIPSKQKLSDGDIVSIDIGVTKNGCVADSCYSFVVGEGKVEHRNLVEAAKQITMYGIGLVKPGLRVFELSSAVATKAEELGYSTMPDLYGHGTGIDLHEAPSIPFVHAPHPPDLSNPRLQKDMVITIEPVVAMQSAKQKYTEDSDQWTLRTIDKSWSAQFEHTILITETGSEILTGQFR